MTGHPDAAALQDILQAGILAPTADNRPVVRMRWASHRASRDVGGSVGAASAAMCGNAQMPHGIAVEAAPTEDPPPAQRMGLHLWAVPDAAQPVQPHRRAFALIATGAMIENMALRSLRHGWALQAAPLPDASQPALWATLQWTRCSPVVSDPLDDAIETRHTNRHFYRRTPVPDDVLMAMTEAAMATRNARLQWLRGAERREALHAIRLAEAERFRRPALHEELFGAVRFDVGWHASADDGLPPATLAVEAPLRPGFALLRHAPVMRATRWLGVPWLLGWRAGWAPCAFAPQLGVLSVPRPADDAAWLAAGRAFERLWLAAQAHGLALQPFGAAVALTTQRPGGGWVSPTLQRTLLDTLTRVCSQAWQPGLFFRVGFANRPRVVTRRPWWERYIDGPLPG